MTLLYGPPEQYMMEESDISRKRYNPADEMRRWCKVFILVDERGVWWPQSQYVKHTIMYCHIKINTSDWEMNLDISSPSLKY